MKMKKLKSKKQKTYKIEYIVSFYIIDIQNNIFEESIANPPWDKIFDSHDMLENRRNAIRHYIDRYNYFFNSGTFSFISHSTFKNVQNIQGNGISMTLSVYDNEDNYFSLNGNDPEELFEFLDFESYHLSNSKEAEFMMVTDHNGDHQTVLKEDFQLFNLWFNNLQSKIISTK